MKTSAFWIQTSTPQKDGLGGSVDTFQTTATVTGYLDLLSGSQLNGISVQNALTEKSTHVLIVSPYQPEITAGMRVKDPRTGRLYLITYADDPGSQQHHSELYLTYTGTEAT